MLWRLTRGAVICTMIAIINYYLTGSIINQSDTVPQYIWLLLGSLPFIGITISLLLYFILLYHLQQHQLNNDNFILSLSHLGRRVLQMMTIGMTWIVAFLFSPRVVDVVFPQTRPESVLIMIGLSFLYFSLPAYLYFIVLSLKIQADTALQHRIRRVMIVLPFAIVLLSVVGLGILSPILRNRAPLDTTTIIVVVEALIFLATPLLLWYILDLLHTWNESQSQIKGDEPLYRQYDTEVDNDV